jgi:hypothetical protein
MTTLSLDSLVSTTPLSLIGSDLSHVAVLTMPLSLLVVLMTPLSLYLMVSMTLQSFDPLLFMTLISFNLEMSRKSLSLGSVMSTNSAVILILQYISHIEPI